MLDIKCNCCGKKFYRSLGRINEAKKWSWNFYCSRSCQAATLKRRSIFFCENKLCSKKIERQQSEISEHNFCSQSCAAIVNNQKHPKRGPGFKICSFCNKRFKAQNLYCSSVCAKNGRRGCSPEELLEIIKSFHKKQGRIPARREIPRISMICRRTFGSWNNAVIKAGLTPNRSHESRMYKRSITKAKDGHLCDSISEAIIDNWLSNNHIEHKKDLPYPDSKHKADWAVEHKKFVEYFGLAKDSPRYDRSIKNKQELCHKNKITLIAIYPNDLYPINNLDKKLGFLKEISNKGFINAR